MPDRLTDDELRLILGPGPLVLLGDPRELVVELLEARARIAELERENIRLSGIEQLHAEQSPLGHVVVTFVEGREPFIHGDHRRVMTAADAIRSVGRSDLPRGTTLKLCELREVADRG